MSNDRFSILDLFLFKFRPIFKTNQIFKFFGDTSFLELELELELKLELKLELECDML